VREVERFPLGLAHFVYEVRLASGRALVVRIGAPGSAEVFAAAARWSARLRPIGVPLPELFAAGTAEGLPYLVLERLPGADLGLVYPTLSADEKRGLARRVAEIQACVGALPEGRGFGWVLDPAGPFAFATWSDVLRGSLARSRRRIERAGLVSGDPVGAVERAAAGLADYFASVRPRAFLDDTTTKNVIVERGRLSGIVDVDVVCYGDPIFPVALTRTALLNEGFALDYTDAWCEALRLSSAQERALRLYTALFCADFLAEIGGRFNRAEAIAFEPERVERLRSALAGQLAELA
jgi:hypothetical protein